MQFSKFGYLLALCAIFTASKAVAQELDTLGYDTSGLAINGGVSAGYDSNIYKDANEIGSAIYMADALVGYGYQSGATQFGIKYSGQYTGFQKNRDDNLFSHDVSVGVKWRPVSSHELSVLSSIKQADEMRGTGLTQGMPFSISSPDRYILTSGGFKYDYSPLGEKGMRFGTSLKSTKRDYDSHREVALRSNISSNDILTSLGYQWRTGRSFSFLYQKGSDSFNDISVSIRDADIQRIGLEFEWMATAASGIAFTFGEETRSFDSNVSDEKTAFWDLSIIWQPLTYSRFEITSSSQQNNSLDQNELVNLVRTVRLDWKHAWSDSYESGFAYTYRNSDSLLGDSREQGFKAASLLTQYNWSERIAFGVSLAWEQNSDSQDIRDYDQLAVTLSIKIKSTV